MMVVIFIVTYLMSFVDMIYTALWAIYKWRKNRVVDADEEYPQYKQETKAKAKLDDKKYGPGKAYDNDIPTWRYTPETSR